MQAIAKIISIQEEYERVLHQYLEVCNLALEHNKNKFPYKKIWGARVKAFPDGIKVEAIIYHDRPQVALPLNLTHDMKIEIMEKPVIPLERTWAFSYQHLKRVVDNSQNYIENPARLDWGWL
jgi:hypothetical protein